MGEEMEFFVYLLERYAFAKDRSSGEVLAEWDRHGVTDEIFDGYFQYHQEDLSYAFADIDSLVASGVHANALA